MTGHGKIGDFLKRAFRYVKEHKLISKGLGAIAPHLGSFSPLASSAGQVAGQLGFGRRLRHHYRVGGGLRLAGAARRHRY